MYRMTFETRTDEVVLSILILKYDSPRALPIIRAPMLAENKEHTLVTPQAFLDDTGSLIVPTVSLTPLLALPN